MIKSSVLRLRNLQYIPLLKPRLLAGFDGPRDVCTCCMVKLDIDVGGHQRENAYMYEVDNLDYDLMLGLAWLSEEGVLLDTRNRSLIFPNNDRVHENDVHSTMDLTQISANAYSERTPDEIAGGRTA
ncbi:hypothetical protein EMCG_03907 [[Emmonsia] crescens]|uniref:Uncharacterized protein n=1 Tax=[Emmonsia] crescens TaxID=73230 RepID=A0A0G2J825_9EURO|nr:hypothetical protein EMCG_03907 [Emmonsia crescens UAMH 3008]